MQVAGRKLALPNLCMCLLCYWPQWTQKGSLCDIPGLRTSSLCVWPVSKAVRIDQASVTITLRTATFILNTMSGFICIAAYPQNMSFFLFVTFSLLMGFWLYAFGLYLELWGELCDWILLSKTVLCSKVATGHVWLFISRCETQQKNTEWVILQEGENVKPLLSAVTRIDSPLVCPRRQQSTRTRNHSGLPSGWCQGRAKCYGASFSSLQEAIIKKKKPYNLTCMQRFWRGAGDWVVVECVKFLLSITHLA